MSLTFRFNGGYLALVVVGLTVKDKLNSVSAENDYSFSILTRRASKITTIKYSPVSDACVRMLLDGRCIDLL